MLNTLVLNERVEADDLIIFSPSVWEWDNSNNNTLNLYNQQLATDLNYVMGQPYRFLNVPINSNNPYNGRFFKLFNTYGYTPALKFNNILKPLINVQNNRSIGIVANELNCVTTAFYSPAILVLDTKVLMAVYTRNKNVRENAYGTTHPERPGSVPEEVEMVFTEDTYAIVTSNGSYSLKLKIEFTPDPQPATIINTTIKKDRPVKIMNAYKFILGVIGNWSGTQTNDYGLYPQAISFQLTNTGEFIMANTQTGVVGAKGTYTFSNNIINGTYKLLSSGETISFTGTLDPNTQKLSCSLGMGTATTGQGKWTVTKR